MRIEDLPEEFRQYGPVRAARAAEVPAEVAEDYERSLRHEFNAGMDYLARYGDLRRDPRLLLEEARTVLTFAFPYGSDSVRRDATLPVISEYALSDDYHDVIRKHLTRLCKLLPEGSRCRICVDSAPIFERYWAKESGLGIIGRNGALIVPGIGCKVFLAEIITTALIEPTPRKSVSCLGCGRCMDACPTGALRPDGRVDARRCLSYLTIEHRGDWTEPVAIGAMKTGAGANTLFGCDRCVAVCPHNVPTGRRPYPLLPGLEPRAEILSLTAEDVLGMTQEEFARRFRRSPLKRAALAGLVRNARSCTSHEAGPIIEKTRK